MSIVSIEDLNKIEGQDPVKIKEALDTLTITIPCEMSKEGKKVSVRKAGVTPRGVFMEYVHVNYHSPRFKYDDDFVRLPHDTLMTLFEQV